MSEKEVVNFSVLSIYAKTVVLWIEFYHREIDKKGFAFAGGKQYDTKEDLRADVEAQIDKAILDGEFIMDISRDEAIALMYP